MIRLIFSAYGARENWLHVSICSIISANKESASVPSLLLPKIHSNAADSKERGLELSQLLFMEKVLRKSHQMITGIFGLMRFLSFFLKLQLWA